MTGGELHRLHQRFERIFTSPVKHGDIEHSDVNAGIVTFLVCSANLVADEAPVLIRTGVTTMWPKTKIAIVALAFGLLLPISGASFAAQQSRHSSSLHSPSAVVKHHSVMTSRAEASRAFARGTSAYPWGPRYNFPYRDRPYGDPDRY